MPAGAEAVQKAFPPKKGTSAGTCAIFSPLKRFTENTNKEEWQNIVLWKTHCRNLFKLPRNVKTHFCGCMGGKPKEFACWTAFSEGKRTARGWKRAQDKQQWWGSPEVPEPGKKGRFESDYGENTPQEGVQILWFSCGIRGVNPSILSGNKSRGKDTDRDSHGNLTNNSKSYQAVDFNSVKNRVIKNQTIQLQIWHPPCKNPSVPLSA